MALNDSVFLEMLDSWFDPRLAAFVRGKNINFVADSIQIAPLDWKNELKRKNIVERQVRRIRHVLELSKGLQFTKEALTDHLLCLCYLWVDWVKPNPEFFITRKVHGHDIPSTPPRLLSLKALVLSSWRHHSRESNELDEFFERSWAMAFRYAKEMNWIKVEYYYPIERSELEKCVVSSYRSRDGHVRVTDSGFERAESILSKNEKECTTPSQTHDINGPAVVPVVENDPRASFEQRAPEKRKTESNDIPYSRPTTGITLAAIFKLDRNTVRKHIKDKTPPFDNVTRAGRKFMIPVKDLPANIGANLKKDLLPPNNRA